MKYSNKFGMFASTQSTSRTSSSNGYTQKQLEDKLFELARYYEMTTNKAEINDLKRWIKENASK